MKQASKKKKDQLKDQAVLPAWLCLFSFAATLMFATLSWAGDAAGVSIKNCNSKQQCIEISTRDLGLSEFAALSAFATAKIKISSSGQVLKEYEALHGTIDFTSNKVTITMINKIKIDRVIDLETFQETDYANPW